jgi:hypothetical protein
MYFTRDQRVLQDAVYGDQSAIQKNTNILAEKLHAQLGEVATKPENNEVSFAKQSSAQESNSQQMLMSFEQS